MNSIDLMKYWFERAIKKDILDNINKFIEELKNY